jgi:hypothetical protein
MAAANCAYVQAVKANLLANSNTFTGSNLFTAAIPALDNTQRPATTAFVNDVAANYYNTQFTTGSHSFSGVNTCPTPATSTNTTQIANCAFVVNKITDYVANVLPTLSLTWDYMNVPTGFLGDASTAVANTQFVQNAVQNAYNGMTTVENTWTANQNFITQAPGNVANVAATCAFVQNALTTFLATDNTFPLVQTFSGGITALYTPQPSNTLPNTKLGYSAGNTTLPASVVLTTATVKNLVQLLIPKGVFIVSIALQLNITIATAAATSIIYGLFTTATTTNTTNGTNIQSYSTNAANLTLTNGQTYNYSICFVINTAVNLAPFFNVNATFSTGTINATYSYSFTKIA